MKLHAKTKKTEEMNVLKNELPPTGFDDDCSPSIEQQIGVYFYLSPTDSEKLFPPKVKPEASVPLTLAPE